MDWPAAALFLLAVALSGAVVVATVAARVGHDIYIANWYTIGGFIFTFILGLTAAIPLYQRGLGQVAVQAFYMHNAVGMWFTLPGPGHHLLRAAQAAEPADLLLRAGRAGRSGPTSCSTR